MRPGDDDGTDPEAKIRHMYQYDEPTGGFLTVTVERDDDGAALTFQFYDEHGQVMYTSGKRSD